MSELVAVLVCIWYMMMGFGCAKLFKRNNLGVNKECPIFVVLIIWWIVVPLCSVFRETDQMKINFTKQPGGILVPASDIEADKMNRFKTGDIYPVDIKLSRNGKFHGKVFSFFNFCFEYWIGGNEHYSCDKQFDVFREHLTVLAGYYDEYYGINGSVRIEAKSISYTNMTQEEFEGLYSALINAAMKNIFKDANDGIYNRLIGFF